MMTMIGTTTTTTTTKRRKGRRRLAPRGAEPADGVRGHRKRAGREAPEHWTGPRGRYLERGALRPRHRHARDLERRRRDRVARTEVAPHHLDVAQHVAQVPRDGELLDRVGELAVLDPQPGSAARVVAGPRVHLEADQLSHVQPPAH